MITFFVGVLVGWVLAYISVFIIILLSPDNPLK